jgi:uncharacterized cupredoxin-like copper-binding protein
VILAATMLLGGCGSSDDAASTVDVTVKEFEFDPAKWTISANEETTLKLTNDGALVHEWVILQDGVTIENESDLPETEEELLADFVYWEQEIEQGDSGTFTFTAPAAGTYQVICAIETHFNAGMNAELVVT